MLQTRAEEQSQMQLITYTCTLRVAFLNTKMCYVNYLKQNRDIGIIWIHQVFPDQENYF
jgi:hypothetical protein